MFYEDEKSPKVFVKVLAYSCYLYNVKTRKRSILNNNFKIAPGPEKHSLIRLRKKSSKRL